MKCVFHLCEWRPKSPWRRAPVICMMISCLTAVSTRGQGPITTVAGGGPNNVPATTAALSVPSGLTLDWAGNLYIFDTGWQRVYKVTPSGQLTVVAGLAIIPFNDTLGDGGPATAANLLNGNGVGTLQGLAVDANGNVFIADAGNFRIRRVDAATGIITTVAGNGTQGSSGNGALANAAELSDPTAVAVDPTGNLYIVDNGLVRRVDAVTQIITAYAGGSAVCATATDAVGDGCPATEASLSASSLAVDMSGNVFIADASTFNGGNNRIRRVDAATGIIATYAGTGVQGYTGDGGNATLADLNTPLSIAIDPANNLFILDSGNSVIRKVDTNQNISSVVALTAGSFSSSGLAVNPSDNLFFNGFFNNSSTNFQVMEVNLTAGTVTPVAGNGDKTFSGQGVLATDAKLEEVNGVAADGAGNLAIADTENYRIRYLDGLTGDITTLAGNGTPCLSANCVTEGAIATTVSLHTPVGVIFSTSGTCGTCVIFTDGTYVRQLNGNVITTYVQDPRFQQLTGLAMDGSQNLYIGDNGNVVWKVDVSKNVTVFAGGGLCAAATNPVGDGCPATGAQLALPFAVALDNGFNLYIAEQNHHRIRRVDVGTGFISTVAGNGVCGYTGDGGLATSAEICAPDGVAVDDAGDIFISDTGNSVIREVNFTTGVITTVVNGSGNIDFTGDGGPTLCAALNFPVGLSLGPMNNPLGDSYLWIADDFSNRVRRIPLSPSTQNACVIVAPSQDASVIGQPVTFTATIAKAINGNPSGTVTFSDGANALNTANVNGGQATFTTSALTVGSHVITAAYSGDGTFSSSTSSPITQVVLSNTPSTAAPTHFSVSAPSTATSGTAFKVTVTALDASNNAVTGYTGTVHFTSSDAQAVLSADYTFTSGTSGDNGAHVFSVTLKTTGSQTISVTDTANASISGASSGITVSAGTAAQFAVSAPASEMAGTAFNFTVTAEDQFKNTVTDYTGTVHFTSTDSQAVLPADYTFTSADNGTHVLSATLKSVGNQTMTATDTTNTPIAGTSNTIAVSAQVSPPPSQVIDNETIHVTDTESLPDVYGSEAVHVADAVFVTPLIQVSAPVAEFSASTLGFSGQSGSQTITVYDIGTASLTLASTAISGSPQFVITQIACSNGATSASTVLPSGGACVLTIGYSASATPANDNGTLVFTDNAALSNLASVPVGPSYTQSIPLSGGGSTTGPPPPPPAVIPVMDNETIHVMDTSSFPDVFDSEQIAVTDQVMVKVIASPTTTSISASTVSYGTAASATVSVTSPGETVAGSVTLGIDGGVASAMSLSSGSAVFNLGVLAAGSHSLAANFAAQGNFLGSSSTSTLMVTQAPLAITVSNASRAYGQPNPSLNNVTYSGFVNGDNASSLLGTLICTTTATQSSTAGTYPITCSGLSSANYAITFVLGTLTVTPAIVTITANNATKILDAPNLALGWSARGFVNGDNASVLSSNPTCSTTATATSPVGSYPITCSGAAAVNYTFTYVAGLLNIQYATGVGHVILSPINANGTSVFKLGQTVPAKFAVYDVNGISIGTPGVVSSFFLTSIISGTTMATVENVVDTNNPDAAFRWDLTGQQWIFNISTANLLAGNTYIFTITLNDGSTIMFQFGLR